MNKTKSQHYVPAFLLSNFTKNKTRQSKFELYDFESRKYRSSKPDKVCKQNHLYTLTDPPGGMDPYVIEKELLGKLENDVKPIISEIIKTKNLPKSKEEYELFFYFLGMLAVRHPSVNNMLSRAIAHTGNMLIDLIGNTLSQSTLDNYYNKSSTPLEERLPLNEVKDFFSVENFYAVANQDVVIPMALNMADTVAKLLLKRNWMILIARKDENFISCDRPLALYATSKGPRTGPVGFGLPYTEVLICLSSKVALIGTFEEIPSPILIADIKLMSIANRVMIDSANRNVFFEDRSFRWIDNDHVTRFGTEIEKSAKYKKFSASKKK